MRHRTMEQILEASMTWTNESAKDHQSKQTPNSTCVEMEQTTTQERIADLIGEGLQVVEELVEVCKVSSQDKTKPPRVLQTRDARRQVHTSRRMDRKTAEAGSWFTTSRSLCRRSLPGR